MPSPLYLCPTGKHCVCGHCFCTSQVDTAYDRSMRGGTAYAVSQGQTGVQLQGGPSSNGQQQIKAKPISNKSVRCVCSRARECVRARGL